MCSKTGWWLMFDILCRRCNGIDLSEWVGRKRRNAFPFEIQNDIASKFQHEIGAQYEKKNLRRFFVFNGIQLATIKLNKFEMGWHSSSWMLVMIMEPLLSLLSDFFSALLFCVCVSKHKIKFTKVGVVHKNKSLRATKEKRNNAKPKNTICAR